MKLVTNTQITLDGVVQGNGGQNENRSGGFERGGWTTPLFDNETATFLKPVLPARRCAPVRPAGLRDLRRLLRSNGRSEHQPSEWR